MVGEQNTEDSEQMISIVILRTETNTRAIDNLMTLNILQNNSDHNSMILTKNYTQTYYGEDYRHKD